MNPELDTETLTLKQDGRDSPGALEIAKKAEEFMDSIPAFELTPEKPAEVKDSIPVFDISQEDDDEQGAMARQQFANCTISGQEEVDISSSPPMRRREPHGVFEGHEAEQECSGSGFFEDQGAEQESRRPEIFESQVSKPECSSSGFFIEGQGAESGGGGPGVGKGREDDEPESSGLEGDPELSSLDKFQEAALQELGFTSEPPRKVRISQERVEERDGSQLSELEQMQDSNSPLRSSPPPVNAQASSEGLAQEAGLGQDMQEVTPSFGGFTSEKEFHQPSGDPTAEQTVDAHDISSRSQTPASNTFGGGDDHMTPAIRKVKSGHQLDSACGTPVNGGSVPPVSHPANEHFQHPHRAYSTVLARSRSRDNMEKPAGWSGFTSAPVQCRSGPDQHEEAEAEAAEVVVPFRKKKGKHGKTRILV